MKLAKIVVPVLILAIIGLFVTKSIITGKVEEKIQTYLAKSISIPWGSSDTSIELILILEKPTQYSILDLF